LKQPISDPYKDSTRTD